MIAAVAVFKLRSLRPGAQTKRNASLIKKLARSTKSQDTLFVNHGPQSCTVYGHHLPLCTVGAIELYHASIMYKYTPSIIVDLLKPVSISISVLN